MNPRRGRGRGTGQLRELPQVSAPGRNPGWCFRELCRDSRSVLSFEHAGVTSCSAAKEAKIYESVLRTSGRKEKHYAALTNRMEYFAEMSEAYFGTNDFPFVRAELKEVDPRMHAMLGGEVWGVRKRKRVT